MINNFMSNSDPINQPFNSVPVGSSILEECRQNLDKLSKKEAQNTLKMLCALYNLKVVPAFSPLGTPQAAAARVTRVNRGTPRKIYNQSPEVKEIRDKIKDLNRQISEKSKRMQSRLPKEDELLVHRLQLFRELTATQNKTLASIRIGSEATG
jgi:hypothetical protein